MKGLNKMNNKDIKDLANWVLDNLYLKVEPLVFKDWGECEIVLPDMPVIFKNKKMQEKLEHQIVDILKECGEFKEYEKEYKLVY